MIGRGDQAETETRRPEDVLDEEIDFAALEEAVIGRRDQAEAGGGRPEDVLDEEIDFAALEEEMIGHRDQKGPEKAGKGVGKEEEIDFAALEEAMIVGRRYQTWEEAGEKETEVRVDREKTKPAEGEEGIEGKVVGEIGAEEGKKVHPEDETMAEAVPEQVRVEDNPPAGRRPPRGRKMAYTVIREEQVEKKAAGKTIEKLPEMPDKTEGGDTTSSGSGEGKIASHQREEMKSEEGKEEPKEMKETAEEVGRGKPTPRRGGRYRKKDQNGSISERKYRRRPDKKERT